MSPSYGTLYHQSIATAEDPMRAAISLIDEMGLDRDPVLIAAFMDAATRDYQTSVKQKMGEERDGYV